MFVHLTDKSHKRVGNTVQAKDKNERSVTKNRSILDMLMGSEPWPHSLGTRLLYGIIEHS